MRSAVKSPLRPRTGVGKVLLGGALLVVLAALSRITLRAKEQVRGPARPELALQKAPAAARGWTNPYDGQGDAVAAGRKLFRQHCAPCHGESLQGLDKAPSLRSPAIQQAPDGVLFWFLRGGTVRHGMPSWSGLPDQRRWQIVSYLKSL